MITLSGMNDVPGVRHGFFTRSGGTSEGLFASRNVSFSNGDNPNHVHANRAACMALLDQPGHALATVVQKHTADVVEVSADGFRGQQPPIADAMVTRAGGVALGILTADCAPVLFAARNGSVIGAAHAGWRGMLAGILENTLEAMAGLGVAAKDMVVAIGPCIGKRSYEVDLSFREAWVRTDPEAARYFTPEHAQGKTTFDLAGMATRRLQRAGVRMVLATPCDTMLEENRFFSHRRAAKKGEPGFGLQLSAIVRDA